ncbi:MAG: glycoside hydrolase family 5 protein, partial [Solirubrobacteraceae bacterium]
QIVGLVAPDRALQGKYVDAHAHFSEDELRTAVADHADLVRFQVSEYGLEPLGALYSPAYVQEVAGGVRAARALGMEVIVSLQAQDPAGEPNRCPLPDAGAARAWDALAPMFADDRGVMFELYNEPGVAATRAGWSQWLDGGPMTYGHGAYSCQAVGMQALVDDIRAAGAPNVIIVPGAAGEQTLAGMPPLADPGSPYDPQLAYGVHYPLAIGGDPTAWNRAFGVVASTVPVIVTEWDAASISRGCTALMPTQAQLLLTYLINRSIGIVGFALDLPGTIVSDYTYAPTGYAGFACGVAGAGPGQALFAEFAAQAAAGDGAQPVRPPAWIVSASTAQRLISQAPGDARQLLNTPRTFVIGADSSALSVLGIPSATPAESFANERTLAAAVAGGRLRAGVRAVVYAPSRSSTPGDQQRNLEAYFDQAALTAHEQGLLLIAAPSTDLARTFAPHVAAKLAPFEFLRRRIAAVAARYADVYVSRAQMYEQSPPVLAGFVAATGAQVARAQRGIELMTELRVSSARRAPTARALLRAVAHTRSSVAGYLLSAASVADTADAGRAVAPAFLHGLVMQDS